jgi:hypothetical protein
MGHACSAVNADVVSLRAVRRDLATILAGSLGYPPSKTYLENHPGANDRFVWPPDIVQSPTTRSKARMMKHE